MKSRFVKRIATRVASNSISSLGIVKVTVTATSGSPPTTFTAQFGNGTTVPGIPVSVPFRSTIAVGSNVWLLTWGPAFLLIHQEN